VQVFDDYGHHPVEIAAVLRAGRDSAKGKVVAVVQPHRYTRLQALFNDFASCFNDADVVIVADVYPAGEKPIADIDRDHLVAAITAHGHRQAIALSGPEALPELVAGLAAPGDYVIFLGAGNITQWAYALPGQLAAKEAA
jgi:UDP-N-acetylmuramate--alanine ligase